MEQSRNLTANYDIASFMGAEAEVIKVLVLKKSLELVTAVSNGGGGGGGGRCETLEKQRLVSIDSQRLFEIRRSYPGFDRV